MGMRAIGGGKDTLQSCSFAEGGYLIRCWRLDGCTHDVKRFSLSHGSDLNTLNMSTLSELREPCACVQFW